MRSWNHSLCFYSIFCYFIENQMIYQLTSTLDYFIKDSWSFNLLINKQSVYKSISYFKKYILKSADSKKPSSYYYKSSESKIANFGVKYQLIFFVIHRWFCNFQPYLQESLKISWRYKSTDSTAEVNTTIQVQDLSISWLNKKKTKKNQLIPKRLTYQMFL